MNPIEEVLTQRLILVQKIEQVFAHLALDLPKRFLRGPIQLKIIEKLNLSYSGWNKKLINEVLLSVGYVPVKVHGNRYYKRLN